MRRIPLDQLPRRIREIEHTWIALADGCRLAARIWLPDDAEGDPVPAVLEYLPYRKNDGTAVRDAARQPYLAGHGYAAVRVDLRGTGESDGIIEDEYTPQELSDALEVIDWLAGQPWCSGPVGMTGISWGGFNSLQVAALQPPALRAIITLCSTDDRYADDVHYRGGCVLASDMLHWASSMLTWNARPPDPRLAGEGWRRQWLERLERAQPFIEPWLSHQRRDGYWAHGSVCEDYSAIRCPVYAVGGWADGYTNAVFRLLEGLSCPRKGLVGPWGHAFPDDASPGPGVGWLQESVRWWDHWLKGQDTGIMEEPLLRVWLQDWEPPRGSYEARAGRWIAEERWPSPRIEPRRLTAGGGVHRAPQSCGAEAGVWCASGQAGDLPGDQRRDDALSLVFDWEPLGEKLEILGLPEVELELAVDRPRALVCVRLCDVAADGTSVLVSRGLLNLTHRDGHAEPRALEPGARYAVRLRLDSAAYAFAAGHRLRLAVSSTYWPWAWPSPEPVELTVLAAELTLPVRPPRAGDASLPAFGEPEQTPPLEVEQLAPGVGGRSLRRDLETGLVEQVFDWDLGGTVRLVPIELVSEDSSRAVYSILEDDPLSAKVEVRAATGMARGDWSARAEVTSAMTADADSFLVTSALDCYEGATRVFARTWSFRFPRDHV
jgi:predicted acyl esterase